MNTDWLIPDWPAAPNVRAVFTSRSGGVSSRPWDSLNLGDHVGDDATNVASNRSLLQQTAGGKAVFLKQVHGFEVVKLEGDTPDGFEADACVSTQANLACTIMVADCLPVLLSNRAGTVVAAAHAGWRGLAGSAGSAKGSGILEAV
ncbi:MAG: laccase domain-containing protein, partial [Pseudomonadota bacterium]